MRNKFQEACRRLVVAPCRTLHVGDAIVDDVEGAQRAGLHTVLVQRQNVVGEVRYPSVASLDRVVAWLRGAQKEPGATAPRQRRSKQ